MPLLLLILCHSFLVVQLDVYANGIISCGMDKLVCQWEVLLFFLQFKKLVIPLQITRAPVLVKKFSFVEPVRSLGKLVLAQFLLALVISYD